MAETPSADVRALTLAVRRLIDAGEQLGARAEQAAELAVAAEAKAAEAVAEAKAALARAAAAEARMAVLETRVAVQEHAHRPWGAQFFDLAHKSPHVQAGVAFVIVVLAFALAGNLFPGVSAVLPFIGGARAP